MSKYDNLYKEGTYVAVSGQQGLTAAGKVLEWDAANHILHLETIPRYLMSNRGWVKNNSGMRVTASFDPTGQLSKRISGTNVQEEYPVNQAIELRGQVVAATAGQMKHYGTLDMIDQHHFGLKPHIGLQINNKPGIINTPMLIPIQGTMLEQNPYRLEDILRAMTPPEEPRILQD